MTTARTRKSRRTAPASASPFAAAMDQLMRDYADLAASWTEEQRIAAALWVIPKLMTHAREGGSFRTLIYTRMGLSEAAYVPLCLGGGLEASNELCALNSATQASAETALAVLVPWAHEGAMEDSGCKKADGSALMMPSAERRQRFAALEIVQTLKREHALQETVIRRLKAELDEAQRRILADMATPDRS